MYLQINTFTMQMTLCPTIKPFRYYEELIHMHTTLGRYQFKSSKRPNTINYKVFYWQYRLHSNQPLLLHKDQTRILWMSQISSVSGVKTPNKSSQEFWCIQTMVIPTKTVAITLKDMENGFKLKGHVPAM